MIPASSTMQPNFRQDSNRPSQNQPILGTTFQQSAPSVHSNQQTNYPPQSVVRQSQLTQMDPSSATMRESVPQIRESGPQIRDSYGQGSQQQQQPLQSNLQSQSQVRDSYLNVPSQQRQQPSQYSDHPKQSLHQQSQSTQQQQQQYQQQQSQQQQQQQAYESFQASSYQTPQRSDPAPKQQPVPRDQLITAEQKALLQLGQRDETMQRKLDQPLLTKLMMGRGNEDEDELGGYYNFDGSVVKQPEPVAPAGQYGRLPQNQNKVQAAQIQGSIVSQKESQNFVPRSENGGISQNQRLDQAPPANETMASIHDQSQQKQLSMDELAYMKEQFMENEERERLNPQNVLIRILFIYAFNSQVDSDQAAFAESTTDRRLYSFFINKQARIFDIKETLIKQEFGFDTDQQRLYFKYKELGNQQMIMDINQFDIEEDILICITINAPQIHIPAILREPLDDIKVADVRLINSRDAKDPSQNYGNKPDPSGNFEIDKFDVDLDKLPWPVYRDWTAEAAFLSAIIIKDKTALLNEEQQFLLQQGETKHLHTSPEFSELAEAEAAFRKLCEDFKKASLYAVHLIVKKGPTPLNLFNLYGDDGDKFVVGGILVRRAKDWTVCGQPFTEQSRMHTTIIGASGTSGGDSGSNLQEISGKIAALDVRNMAALRNRVSRLVVPLACLVDYFGLKFECQSLAPISINSMVYGSDVNGLTFTNKDEHAELMAKQIASILNIKPHYLEEQATGKLKLAYLPYTVQLHRNKDLQDDYNLYLVNPFRLFPQDESLRQTNQSQAQVPIQDIMSKQLRPELCLANNKGDPDTECQYFTWRKPTKCDECGDWIHDHEYYYFEKKSIDKSQRHLVQYYCCINCYMEKLPTESFKYPVNKIIKKELPPKERLQFYQNMTTGRRYFDIQFARVPLNPDAYFHLSGGRDKAEKISDQEEILRAAQKLKDEVIGKLVEELNNVEQDPLSGDQLETLMHQRGINMRILGRICTIAELNHIREMCVVEIIARSAKLLIKDGLTFLADDEEAGFQSENIKKCVLHYLLEIFNSDDGQNASGAQSIWDFITEHARKKFQVTIERDVLSKVNMAGLLMSLTQKLRIKLRKSPKEIDFYQVSAETGLRNFLTIEDIESITPVVKDYIEKQPMLTTMDEVFPSSLNIVLESARLKDSQGKRSQWHMAGGPERDEATDLFRLAASICEQVLGNQSVRYARVIKEFADHLESRHQEKGRPENSRWNKSFAIPEDDLSSEARFFFNTAMQSFKDIGLEICVEMAEIYVAMARLVKPRSAQYSHYREQDSGQYEVFQNLMSAVDIYELLLGYDHPETADTYTKMALAYQEQGNFAAASPWIRRSFTVFYKCFGPHDPITLSAYEQLKGIETNVDSKLDQVPYEDLPHVIFEIEKQQKMMANQQQQLAILGGGLRQLGM